MRQALREQLALADDFFFIAPQKCFAFGRRDQAIEFVFGARGQLRCEFGQ